MFNEYSFVPRSAILNGLGSLRILPYRPSAGGTRPIKGRWRGGGERKREREKENEMKGDNGRSARCTARSQRSETGRTGVACLALILFRLFFYDNISPRRFRIYRVVGKIWRAAGCVATR